MSVFMTKPWQEATPEALQAAPVQTGVYEVSGPDGTPVDIGFAGSFEPFGLRSKLQALSKEYGIEGMQFRVELHVQYQSRYVELVLAHKARHGELPQKVAERGEVFRGRLTLDE